MRLQPMPSLTSRTIQHKLLLNILACLFFSSACSIIDGLTGEGDPDEPKLEAVDLLFTETPDEYTNRTIATFQFSCNNTKACEFTCTLNQGDSEPCQSPYELNNLTHGKHSLKVIASSPGFAPGEKTYSWRVDRMPPVASFEETPEEYSSNLGPRFRFKCTDETRCRIRCTLDNADYSECDQFNKASVEPPKDGIYTIDLGFAPTEEGMHEFHVEFIDLAGNKSDIKHIWTIDITPPDLNVSGGPASSPTTETSATFTVDCDKTCSSLLCENWKSESPDQVEQRDCLDHDGNGFTHDLMQLEDGEYNFGATAIDEAGNSTKSSTYTWTVDTTPPEITIDCPDAFAVSPSAEIEFTSNEPRTTFECKFDNSDYFNCTSPWEISNLPTGQHDFEVRATDEAGWTSLSDCRWQYGRTWRSIAATARSTCATRIDYANQLAGTLWCWGDNTQGELANNSVGGIVISSATPAYDFPLVTKVVGGDHHFCAIKDDNGNKDLLCWGKNENFEVGNANFSTNVVTSLQSVTSPSSSSGPIPWTQVSLGADHSCASSGNDLYCWGLNLFGQSNTSSAAVIDRPTELTQMMIQIPDNGLQAGQQHTCVIKTNGELLCWGIGEGGRLGIGNEDNVYLEDAQAIIPFQAFNGGWQGVATSATNTCGILERTASAPTELYCWGPAGPGLGRGETPNSLDHLSPFQVGTDVGWYKLWASTSANTFCASKLGQPGLWCWGDNSRGQVGVGHQLDVHEPTLVHTSTTVGEWLELAIGAEHTCGINQFGGLHCWGSNLHGQFNLNRGVFPGTTVPMAIP